MKVLIWLSCLFIVNAIIVALRMFAGIQLGAIPSFIADAIMFFSARALCKAWDRHKEEKNNQQYESHE